MKSDEGGSVKPWLTPRVHDFLCDFAATALVPAIGTIIFNFMTFLADGKSPQDLSINIMDFSIGTIFAAFGWASALKDLVAARRFLIYSNIMILILLLTNVFLTYANWLTRQETVILVDVLALVGLALVIWNSHKS